jgi:hypothetical protein
LNPASAARTNRSLDFARDLVCGLPLGCASLTPAKRLDQTDPSTSLGISAFDFAQARLCGLPLGCASLTPAKRLDQTDPSTSLGISPAGSRSAAPRSRPQSGSTLRNFTPKKAVLLDNHGGNPQHPTQWEKSIKTQMIQQYNKQIL